MKLSYHMTQHRWILVAYDIDEFSEIPANREIVKQARLNEPLDMEFNYSKIEVEVRFMFDITNLLIICQ